MSRHRDRNGDPPADSFRLSSPRERALPGEIYDALDPVGLLARRRAGAQPRNQNSKFCRVGTEVFQSSHKSKFTLTCPAIFRYSSASEITRASKQSQRSRACL